MQCCRLISYRLWLKTFKLLGMCLDMLCFHKTGLTNDTKLLLGALWFQGTWIYKTINCQFFQLIFSKWRFYQLNIYKKWLVRYHTFPRCSLVVKYVLHHSFRINYFIFRCMYKCERLNLSNSILGLSKRCTTQTDNLK